MSELSPIIPRPYRDYENNLANRVREPEMNTSESYALLAELDQSPYGRAGELQVRLAKVQPNELGKRASLLICVLDPELDDALVYLNAESHDGLITPTRRRITHPKYNNIGIISQGYLLKPDDILTLSEAGEPETLDERAPHHSFTDTRTSVLSLSGISLGYS